MKKYLILLLAILSDKVVKTSFKIAQKQYLILIIIALIGFTSCKNQPSEPITDEAPSLLKSKYLKEDLVTISKTLVNYLSDKRNQKFLEKQINSSEYVENIIEFSEFLNMTNTEKEGNPSVFSDLLAYVPQNMNFEKFRYSDFGLIDIYFPYKEHRKKWKAGDDLIVVPVYLSETKEKKEVVGYSLNGGDINISTETPTDIPTLVVAFSEKRGQYILDNNMNNVSSDENGTAVSNRFELRLINIYVKKDYEGWLMGDMEIYVKVKQKYLSDTYFGPWHEHGWWSVAANTSTDIPATNIAWAPYLDFEIRIEIWEYDVSSPDDFVADEYYDSFRIGTHWVTWSNWLGSIASIPWAWSIPGTSGDDMQIRDGQLGSQDYDCLILRRWNNLQIAD